MICPECSYNQKYSDGMTCTKCKYRFLFNPKTDKINDSKFSKAIKSVNVNDSVYFTFTQFYVEFTRLNWIKASDYFSKSFIWILIAGLVGYAMFESMLTTIGIVLITFIVACIVIKTNYEPRSYSEVEKLFLRWVKKKKGLEKFVFQTSLHDPPPTPIDSDVYDYGVEAILFVEEDIYVDLFVLNDIHTDLKALVMSKTGYPNYLLPTAKDLLKNNPETPIFTLHNGLNDGDMLDVVKKTYGITNREIIDMGLFANDFSQVEKLKKSHKVPNQPFDIFSKNEMVNLLTISMNDRISIAASAAMIFPHDDPSYGSFG